MDNTMWMLATVALAAGVEGAPPPVRNPFAATSTSAVRIDVAGGTVNGQPRPLVTGEPRGAVDFSDLDRYAGLAPPPAPVRLGNALSAGWVQVGDMVVPEAVSRGALMVGPKSFVSAARRPQPAPIDSCAFPEETPSGIYEGDTRPGGEYPRRGTIYLNFVGGMLEANGENSAENSSNLALGGHTYPPFTGGEAKAVAVAQAVSQDFAPWAIRVVYNPRPRKVLPYTMVMVGGHYTDTTSGPASGVAPLDCEDFGQRNVCYSFTNQEPATSQANVISQEVGHTYGLQHTYGADRIMSYEGNGDKLFGNNCQQTFTVAGQAGGCAGINKCHCGVGDLQNDNTTISMIFAAPGPDNTPPTIEVTAPADGATFAPGEPVLVELDVWDDFGGYGWKLVVENEVGEVIVDQPDYQRVLMFELGGLPPGDYTLTGEIEDQADHVTTHSVTIHVEAPGEGSTGGSSGGDEAGASGDDSGSGTDATGEDHEDSDASATTQMEPSAGGEDDADGPLSQAGCACGLGEKSSGSSLFVGLLTAGLGRRRRVRRSSY